MKHEVLAYGMSEITSTIIETNVDDVACLFDGISVEDIKRPISKIDILIGTDACQILPIVYETKGNLQLMRNQFGFCLRGKHPSIKTYKQDLNTNHVIINHVEVNVNDVIIESNRGLKLSLDRFLSDDGLGISCNPRCGNCKCGKCPIGLNQYSIKEENELLLIKGGLVHDSNKRKWTVNYP